AAVLPDDGRMHRAAVVAPPQDNGFALICDADGGYRAGMGRRALERGAARRQGRRPDLLGIVLDPAVAREPLADLLTAGAEGPARPVEQDCPAAGRSLVDGEQSGSIWHRDECRDFNDLAD